MEGQTTHQINSMNSFPLLSESQSMTDFQREIIFRAENKANTKSPDLSGSSQGVTPATTVQDIHANHFELLFHQIGIFMRNTGELSQSFFRTVNNHLLTVKLTDTRSVSSPSAIEESSTAKSY